MSDKTTFFHLPYALQLEYLPLLNSRYIEACKTKVEQFLISADVA